MKSTAICSWRISKRSPREKRKRWPIRRPKSQCSFSSCSVAASLTRWKSCLRQHVHAVALKEHHNGRERMEGCFRKARAGDHVLSGTGTLLFRSGHSSESAAASPTAFTLRPTSQGLLGFRIGQLSRAVGETKDSRT